jgi:predicted RNA binding protein YcfA (HicA-like mRNA interferase family)
VLSGAELVRLLGKVGYRQARQRGSHVRMACQGRSPVTVPMHDELDRGTLRSILRAAGITPEELASLLD